MVLISTPSPGCINNKLEPYDLYGGLMSYWLVITHKSLLHKLFCLITFLCFKYYRSYTDSSNSSSYWLQIFQFPLITCSLDTLLSSIPDFAFYVGVIFSFALENVDLYLGLMFPTPNSSLTCFSGIMPFFLLASAIYVCVSPSSPQTSYSSTDRSSWKLFFNYCFQG